MSEIDNNDPVELSAIGLNWLTEYRRIQAQIKDLEEKADVAREHVVAELGDSQVGTYGGAPVINWQFVERNSFDQKKAKAMLSEEAVAACMTKTTVRYFKPITKDEA